VDAPSARNGDDLFRGALALRLRGARGRVVSDVLAPLCNVVRCAPTVDGVRRRFLRECRADAERADADADADADGGAASFDASDAAAAAALERDVASLAAELDGTADAAAWLDACAKGADAAHERVAASRKAAAAADAKIDARFRGVATLAATLHVTCHELAEREDERYAVSFEQHAAIFRRALRAKTRKRKESGDAGDDAVAVAAIRAAATRELEFGTLRAQAYLLGQRLPSAMRARLNAALVAALADTPHATKLVF
jgi:hypothetical protein